MDARDAQQMDRDADDDVHFHSTLSDRRSSSERDIAKSAHRMNCDAVMLFSVVLTFSSNHSGS